MSIASRPSCSDSGPTTCININDAPYPSASLRAASASARSCSRSFNATANKMRFGSATRRGVFTFGPTANIGTKTVRSRLLATEPKTSCPMRPRPWVPMMSRSASRRCISSRTTSAAETPCRTTESQVTPSLRAFCTSSARIRSANSSASIPPSGGTMASAVQGVIRLVSRACTRVS